MAFYHGSRRPLPVGVTLRARTSEGHFRKSIEDAMEEARPAGVPSRLSSFFLVDGRDLIRDAGGSTDYVYRVTPVGVYSKHHNGWMGSVYDAMIPFLRHGASQEEKDEATPKLVHIGEWAHNYWEGVPYRHRPRQAKFLAPEIVIEEELTAPFGL
jgi:hypothetical protein